MKKDPTKEVWVRDKSKSAKLIEFTIQSKVKNDEAKNEFDNHIKDTIRKGLTSNEKQFKTICKNEVVSLYHENYSRTDLPRHHFEERTELAHTCLVKEEVPFKKMTATGGFQKILLEEANARNIQLTEDERKKHSIVKKKVQEHEGNNLAFKPVLPYERFKWY